MKSYKELSVDEQKKYGYVISKLRLAGNSFATYQRSDGSWAWDIVNVIWGCTTPTGKVSSKYFQYLRFDMRRNDMQSVMRKVEEAQCGIEKLPNGYKWTEPIMFSW